MIEAKKMINIIKTLISSNNKKLHFNTKRKAVIQSLNVDETVNITINNELFENVKTRAGLNPQVDEVVFVEVPNNILKDMYVDTAGSVTGGGGSGEVAWADIQGKPSSSVVNIDDAVTKRHTHSNQSILNETQQSFTTTLKTKLDGISENANNYTHPTGFSNQPGTALTGSNVISQITVNTNGHVTGVSSRSLTTTDIGAEPSFSKNTAFNKNFGTTAGTVAEGNHTHTVYTYTHNQILPSDIWVIEHNQNKYPSVSVVDSAGSLIYGDVIYNSNTSITVNFSATFSGKAYLN